MLTIFLFFLLIIIFSFIVIDFLYLKKSFKLNKKNIFFDFLKKILLFLIIIISLVGLYGLTGKIDVTKIIGNGTNIVIALDVSKSMLANDIGSKDGNYSRLESAKLSIKKFVLNNDINNYSLIVFAGDSNVLLPFTNDISVFLSFLDKVDNNNVSLGGTNIKEVVEKTNRMLKGKKGMVLLYTDGGEDDIGLQSSENIFNIIGVGSGDGSYIPDGINTFGQQEYKTYNGQRVISKLNPRALQELADDLNGNFYVIKNIDDTKNINIDIEKQSNELIKKTFPDQVKVIRREFIIVAFMLFVIYLSLGIFWRKEK